MSGTASSRIPSTDPDKVVRTEFYKVQATVVIEMMTVKTMLMGSLKNFCASDCRLSLEKTCIPKIFIGPSKTSVQFSVFFQNFTQKYCLHQA